MESVKTRCKAVHKECMRFTGCYARVTRLKPTGVSPSDVINMATALYNGMDIQAYMDDCGKPFRFVQAWRILKKHEKYMGTGTKAVIEASRKVSSNDASESKSTGRGAADITDDPEELSPRRHRPIGRKRAKQEQQKKKEVTKKLILAAATVAAQRERNEALKRHYEIMLFTNAPSSCNSNEAVEYCNIMRARALKKIREEEKRKSAHTRKSIDGTTELSRESAACDEATNGEELS